MARVDRGNCARETHASPFYGRSLLAGGTAARGLKRFRAKRAEISSTSFPSAALTDGSGAFNPPETGSPRGSLTVATWH